MTTNTDEPRLPTDPRKWSLEMARIAPPPAAEKLAGCDWDTLKRNYPDKVVKISKRREGMRVGHALRLA
jgi:hypothetical protein